MITERTLRQWRKDALKSVASRHSMDTTQKNDLEVQISERILRLTQELLDQHLIKKG